MIVFEVYEKSDGVLPFVLTAIACYISYGIAQGGAEQRKMIYGFFIEVFEDFKTLLDVTELVFGGRSRSRTHFFNARFIDLQR